MRAPKHDVAVRKLSHYNSNARKKHSVSAKPPLSRRLEFGRKEYFVPRVLVCRIDKFGEVILNYAAELLQVDDIQYGSFELEL